MLEGLFLCVIGAWRTWDVCSFDVAWRDISCDVPSWLCVWQICKVNISNLVFPYILSRCWRYKLWVHEVDRMMILITFTLTAAIIVFLLLLLFFHHLHCCLTNSKICSCFFLNDRPASVPEGAHVQWEIELLGFEMPKVVLLILIEFARRKWLKTIPVGFKFKIF